MGALKRYVYMKVLNPHLIHGVGHNSTFSLSQEHVIERDGDEVTVRWEGKVISFPWSSVVEAVHAVQEQSAREEVPHSGEGGQNQPGHGQGMGQGEQGKKAAGQKGRR